MQQNTGQRVVAGLVLIAIGLALYWFELYAGLGATAVVFVAGSAFLAGYLVSRTFGFLVPAALLLAVGVGELVERFTDFHASTTLWLGIGFLGVSVCAWIYERRKAIWPLVPGALLVLVAVPDAWRLIDVIHRHWPLLLVAVGLAVLFGASTGRKARPGAGD